jgi:hypothetical protein
MGEHTVATDRGPRAARRGRPRARTRARTRAALGTGFGAAVIAAGASAPAAAQPPAHPAPHQEPPREGASPEGLPFAVGERLGYRVRVGKLGDVGRGAMWVEGPADVRGQSTYRLRFEFGTRVGPVKVVNQTESWLDPERMAALRFHKREKHPLNTQEQRVELYPAQGRWQDAKGGAGELLCAHPLDELSYIYYLRTLPLPADTAFSFAHHFDAARNPTVVRVVGRETVTTPAGEFRTVVVEMRVRDGRHYKGDGVIRINLSDDAARLPVRIQSQMPVVGAAVLTLESVVRGGAPERTIARIP